MIRPPRIIALDLSLTAAGLAWSHNHLGLPDLGLRTAAPRTNGHERLHDLTVEVAAACRCHPHLAVIEGLYVGHRNNTLALGALHSVVTQWLWYQSIPYVYVAPGTRAVYATGEGDARKPAVLRAARLTYGHLFPDGVAGIGDDNQADALILLAMALDHFGAPLVEVPETHRRALSSVDWASVEGIPLPGGAASSWGEAAARRGSAEIMP